MNQQPKATATHVRHFTSAEEVSRGLAGARYVADNATAQATFLADALAKPLLLEGPAGTGKTQLALSIAELTGSRLIRLQCYQGIDEARALFEWDYRKQLLAIQRSESDGLSDVFSEEFLLSRPLLDAVRATEPVVLLIDEVDQLDVEAEAFLLEFLSNYQVTVPELGTVTATRTPLVFLTSNNNRELSEALRRRCLFLHVGYPSPEREREIISARVPGLSDQIVVQISDTVTALRNMGLKKSPSVSETLDWAQTLSILGTQVVTDETVVSHANILLKHQSDINTLRAELMPSP